MSEATLFCFGAVIFLVAFTGAILYGMSATEQKFIKETTLQKPQSWEVSLDGVISRGQKAKTK